ncbi:MAG: SCP2 sterol-binding domain-containing protein [Candidatus Bathyarchaeia archaeon]
MMEIKTPKEFFEKVLPSRFNASKTQGVDVAVQVNVIGGNGGVWTVTIRDQRLEVKEGANSSPTLAISMAEKDFLDVVNGRMEAGKAFFTGKIHFKGNVAFALKLKEMGFL